MMSKLKSMEKSIQKRKQERNEAEEEENASLSESENSSSASSESSFEGEIPFEKNPLLTKRDVKILSERKQLEEGKKKLNQYVNKQRILVLCSRGVTTRFRHLMEDVKTLLPHHRTEVKHDTKKQLSELNEICEMKACNGCVFFEVRKKKDLFMWVTRNPLGPSAKFHVTNIHTMDELKMTGNALLGSRPILSFAREFEMDEYPELSLVKELLSLTFNTPKGHPKSKPFVDRVMQISYVDNKIWIRNYQIADVTTDKAEIKRKEKLGEEAVNLIEIGPRFVLTLVKIFEGGFGGKPLYENGNYISPNTVRSEMNRSLGQKYIKRKLGEKAREERKVMRLSNLPEDPLKNVFQ